MGPSSGPHVWELDSESRPACRAGCSQPWDLRKLLLPVSGPLGLGRGSRWPSSGTAAGLSDGTLETLLPMVTQSPSCGFRHLVGGGSLGCLGWWGVGRRQRTCNPPLLCSVALIPDGPTLPLAVATGGGPQWRFWRMDSHLAPALSRAWCSGVFPVMGSVLICLMRKPLVRSVN